MLNKLENNLEGALEHYNKSLDISIKANNRYAQGRLYNNIANIWEMTMDFERAIEFQKLRLDIATDQNESDSIIKACSCLAALYHTIDDCPNAIR